MTIRKDSFSPLDPQIKNLREIILFNKYYKQCSYIIEENDNATKNCMTNLNPVLFVFEQVIANKYINIYSCVSTFSI